MKSVKIRIKGDLVILDYCSKKMMEDSVDGEEYNDEYDVFFSNFYTTGAWDKIEALYVDDDEDNNLVKQKGKYVKTKEYFHNLFNEDSDHPLPVEVHYRYYYSQELEYVIKLEDDEEFDLKKVQLIKEDYTCSEFPYFILCSKILYDGKEVLANDEFNDWTEYCPEMKTYNTAIIDKLLI